MVGGNQDQSALQSDRHRQHDLELPRLVCGEHVAQPNLGAGPHRFGRQNGRVQKGTDAFLDLDIVATGQLLGAGESFRQRNE